VQVKKVSVQKFATRFKMTKVNEVDDSQKFISSNELNRMGLQLTGFFESFPFERIQLIGNVEWQYLNSLDPVTRSARIEAVMQYEMPCVVFSRDLEVFHEFIELGNQKDIPIFVTSKKTTAFATEIIKFVELELAERMTMHGVLVDINGVGTLILGKSGVGKSETALELVKRGHTFIADDAIEIIKVSDKKVIGTAPELIRNFMEIRGIGIVDISKLYGIGSVRETEQVDLIVQFDEWSKEKEYDRLGLDESFMEILGVKIAILNIPVKPGRNLAVILEAAARNFSLKNMGFNAALELDNKLKALGR